MLIAEETADDLEAALEQFKGIAVGLGGGSHRHHSHDPGYLLALLAEHGRPDC
jgi:hypothetical protein